MLRGRPDRGRGSSLACLARSLRRVVVGLSAGLCVMAAATLVPACHRVEGGEDALAELASPTAPEPACRALAWNRAQSARPLVFVLSDTTRRDRMGIYGGPAETPAFDRFAREHLYFTRAKSPAPWTKPSVATLMTGLHPSQHRVRSHPKLRAVVGGDASMSSDSLPEALETLAEVFQKAGYRTGAIVSNAWIAESLGFSQGFETFDTSMAGWNASGEQVTDLALRWLEGIPDGEPYFLYVHYLDAHGPYGRLTRDEVREQAATIASDPRRLPRAALHFLETQVRFTDGEPLAADGGPLGLGLLEMAYDRGVENFDRAFGRLLDTVRARPGWPETAVVVTSDHGEALFERGWGNHGKSLFDEETGIPLAMRLPGVEGENPVACPLGLIDMMATLCAFNGLDCPSRDQGVSLIGADPEAEAPARYVITEGVIAHPHHRAIENRRYKLVHRPPPSRLRLPEWSLYAVGDDPGMTRDLLAETPVAPEAQHAFEALREALGRAVASIETPVPGSVPIDDATRERLRELGYVE